MLSTINLFGVENKNTEGLKNIGTKVITKNGILTLDGYDESIDADDKKAIVVAIPIYGEPMSYINQGGNIDGLNFHVWKEIYNSLQKRLGDVYEIKYVIVKDSNTDNLVEGLKSRKYDIVVGDYTSNPSRLNYVDYTYPYMSVKDVGVYKIDGDMSIEYRVFKKIMEILYYPFIILIILTLISTLYVSFVSKKSSYIGSFAQMLNGILGDRGGLLNGTSFVIKPGKDLFTWAFAVLIIVISFAFLFYVQTVAISKSLDVINKNKDPFLYPEGKKVLVSKGSPIIQELKNCCDIIAIEANTDKGDIESISKEFLKREKRENLIGFYYSGVESSKWIDRNTLFAISDSTFSAPSPVSFMVSKYKPELLYELNKSIAETNWNSVLNDQCKKFVNRLCFASQY
jgi:ABC-type amino acid transport substrate-binding protein